MSEEQEDPSEELRGHDRDTCGGAQRPTTQGAGNGAWQCRSGVWVWVSDIGGG